MTVHKWLAIVVGVALALLVCLSGRSTQGASLYWTEYGTVYRATADGLNKESVYAANSANGYVCGLAIDPVTSKLYAYGRSDPATADAGYGFVRRMNLDGSSPENLITAGLGTITYGFALDVANGTMYIGEHGQLKQANLDGSGLHNLPLTPLYAGEIKIDHNGQTMYYTENDTLYGTFEGVRRADLDGNNVEGVFSGPASSFALDLTAGEIYVSGGRPVVGGQTIQRMNLDGTGLETLVSGLSR